MINAAAWTAVASAATMPKAFITESFRAACSPGSLGICPGVIMTRQADLPDLSND